MFKGTVSVIASDSPSKDGNAWKNTGIIKLNTFKSVKKCPGKVPLTRHVFSPISYEFSYRIFQVRWSCMQDLKLFTPLLSTPDLKNKFFMIIFVIKTKPILETTEKEKLYDKTSLYFTTIKKLIKSQI